MAAAVVVIKSQALPLCHPGGSRGGSASSGEGGEAATGPRTPHAEASGILEQGWSRQTLWSDGIGGDWGGGRWWWGGLLPSVGGRGPMAMMPNLVRIYGGNLLLCFSFFPW